MALAEGLELGVLAAARLPKAAIVGQCHPSRQQEKTDEEDREAHRPGPTRADPGAKPQTNSRKTISVESDRRGPSFRIRV